MEATGTAAETAGARQSEALAATGAAAKTSADEVEASSARSSEALVATGVAAGSAAGGVEEAGARSSAALDDVATKASASGDVIEGALAGGGVAAGKATDEIEKGGSKAETALASVGSKAESSSKSLTKFGNWGTAAVVGIAAGVVDLGVKFQSATTAMAAAGDIPIQTANAIGKAFLNSGDDVIFSAKEQEGAYGSVVGQLSTLKGYTDSAATAAKFMSTSMDLAEESGSQLGSTTADLSKLMQTFQIPIKDVGSASTDLFNASRLTGTGIDQVSSSLSTLKSRLGVTAPSLSALSSLSVDFAEHGLSGSKALRQVNTAMNALLKPQNDLLVDNLKLNQATQDLPPSLQTLAQQYDSNTISTTQLTTATEAMTPAQQQAWTAFTAASGAVIKAKDAVQLTGITVDNAKGQFVGMGNVITQVDAKLKGHTQAQQLAILSTILGATANKALLNTFLAGAAGYDKATSAVTNHKSASNALAVQQKTLGHEFEATKVEVEDLATKVGVDLVPKLEVLATDAGKVFSWLEKNKDAAYALAAVIGVVLTAAVAVFAEQKISKLVTGLGKIGSELGTVAQKAGAAAEKMLGLGGSAESTTTKLQVEDKAAQDAGGGTTAPGGAGTAGTVTESGTAAASEIAEAMTTAGETVATSITTAGETVAASIKAAMATGGETAATEVGAGEVAGGEKVAAEVGVGEATGGATAATEITAGEVVGGDTVAGEIGVGEITGGKVVAAEIALAEETGGHTPAVVPAGTGAATTTVEEDTGAGVGGAGILAGGAAGPAVVFAAIAALAAAAARYGNTVTASLPGPLGSSPTGGPASTDGTPWNIQAVYEANLPNAHMPTGQTEITTPGETSGTPAAERYASVPTQDQNAASAQAFSVAEALRESINVLSTTGIETSPGGKKKATGEASEASKAATEQSAKDTTAAATETKKAAADTAKAATLHGAAAAKLTAAAAKETTAAEAHTAAAGELKSTATAITNAANSLSAGKTSVPQFNAAISALASSNAGNVNKKTPEGVFTGGVADVEKNTSKIAADKQLLAADALQEWADAAHGVSDKGLQASAANLKASMTQLGAANQLIEFSVEEALAHKKASSDTTTAAKSTSASATASSAAAVAHKAAAQDTSKAAADLTQASNDLASGNTKGAAKLESAADGLNKAAANILTDLNAPSHAPTSTAPTKHVDGGAAADHKQAAKDTSMAAKDLSKASSDLASGNKKASGDETKAASDLTNAAKQLLTGNTTAANQLETAAAGLETAAAALKKEASTTPTPTVPVHSVPKHAEGGVATCLLYTSRCV